MVYPSGTAGGPTSITYCRSVNEESNLLIWRQLLLRSSAAHNAPFPYRECQPLAAWSSNTPLEHGALKYHASTAQRKQLGQNTTCYDARHASEWCNADAAREAYSGAEATSSRTSLGPLEIPTHTATLSHTHDTEAGAYRHLAVGGHDHWEGRTRPNISISSQEDEASSYHPVGRLCPFPGCKSSRAFRRRCDLRKHYRRHLKLFRCRFSGCKHADEPSFSSQKDQLRHEATHRPSLLCGYDGCGRMFSRVDNMVCAF
jgi:hypothetical protein